MTAFTRQLGDIQGSLRYQWVKQHLLFPSCTTYSTGDLDVLQSISLVCCHWVFHICPVFPQLLTAFFEEPKSKSP